MMEMKDTGGSVMRLHHEIDRLRARVAELEGASGCCVQCEALTQRVAELEAERDRLRGVTTCIPCGAKLECVHPPHTTIRGLTKQRDAVVEAASNMLECWRLFFRDGTWMPHESKLEEWSAALSKIPPEDGGACSRPSDSGPKSPEGDQV